MPEKYRYSWMTDLEEPDFTALLNAIEHFRNEIAKKCFKGQGAIIWGDDVMESIDTMYALLMSEWERKNLPTDEL